MLSCCDCLNNYLGQWLKGSSSKESEQKQLLGAEKICKAYSETDLDHVSNLVGSNSNPKSLSGSYFQEPLNIKIHNLKDASKYIKQIKLVNNNEYKVTQLQSLGASLTRWETLILEIIVTKKQYLELEQKGKSIDDEYSVYNGSHNKDHYQDQAWQKKIALNIPNQLIAIKKRYDDKEYDLSKKTMAINKLIKETHQLIQKDMYISELSAKDSDRLNFICNRVVEILDSYIDLCERYSLKGPSSLRKSMKSQLNEIADLFEMITNAYQPITGNYNPYEDIMYYGID